MFKEKNTKYSLKQIKSTKTKQLTSCIGGAKVWNNSCWKWLKLELAKTIHLDEIWNDGGRAKKHAFLGIICKIGQNQGFWAVTA